MFQNLEQGGFVEEKEERKLRDGKLFSKVFELKNIVVYIVTFMVSIIGIGQAVSPFSLAIVGASLASGIPALGIITIGLIGNIVGIGVSAGVNYILILLLVLASFLVKPPRYNEEYKNEKIKLSRKLFFSTILVGTIKGIFGGITIYALLQNIFLSILVVAFYKIFVNGVGVLQDIKENKAFSLEEVMGASLILAIAFASFGNLSIFGFSIRNIFCILIVLILGWKNGGLVGATAGISIGVTLGVIAELEPVVIAAYALSGLLSGIFNKFGRIGVIVGFVIGNVVFSYIAKIGTEHLILIREILIASIGLLAVPKSININIEDFFGKDTFLPIWSNRSLNKSKEAIEKLNSVSNVIQDMANTYGEALSTNTKEKDLIKRNKEIFISNLLDNLVGLEENILYEDISKVDGSIVNEIYNILKDKQEIERSDLLKTFAKFNNYIIGFDDENVSKYLEKNIMQIVNCINSSYKISKADFIFEEKIKENKKNMQAQLDGVSKAIANIAEDLKEDIKEDIKKEEQYAKQKKEIKLLLEEKNIKVSDISINKKENERFFVTIYFKVIVTKKDLLYIEKILEKVLQEKIVLNKYGITKETTLEDVITRERKLEFLSDDKFCLRNKLL